MLYMNNKIWKVCDPTSGVYKHEKIWSYPRDSWLQLSQNKKPQ